MSTEIFNAVLSFAIRVIGWRIQDSCSPLLGAGMVAVNIINPHHNGLAGDSTTFLPGDDDRPWTEGKLGTVIADPQSFDKAKTAAEPVDGLANIGIREFWNDHASWHGSIS